MTTIRVILAATACLLACHGRSETDPCQGIACSDHGECNARDDGPGAVCVCDPGYHAEWPDCVPDGTGTDGDADAGADSSTDPDAEPDSSPDAEPDASPDAEPDASPDAEPDSSPDAEPDSSPDAEPDADTDEIECVVDPEGHELCNGLDDDLDGYLECSEVDDDGDGFLACADCDDGNVLARPFAREIIDEYIDNDCDGIIDGGVPVACSVNVPDEVDSIQAAIDGATDDDVICVCAGTYHENIDFRDRSVHVLGVAGPRFTFIQGDGEGSVVTIAGGQGSATLEGFTVTGGNGGWAGGGVFISVSSTEAVIGCTTSFLTDLVIRDNEPSGIWIEGCGSQWPGEMCSSTLATRVVVADNGEASGVNIGSGYNTLTLSSAVISGNRAVEGGGLRKDTGNSAVLDNVLITGNTATTAGAIYSFEGRLILSSSVITNNVASGSHGGIYHETHGGWLEATNVVIAGNSCSSGAGGLHVDWSGSNSEPTMAATNAIIVGNTSGSGVGGIYVGREVTATLRNTVIAHNQGSDSGGIQRERLGLMPLIVEGCVFWENDPCHVVGADDPLAAESNHEESPEFRSYAAGALPESHDFHLSATSPLIDAGLPDLFDPDGGPSDIGAYGGPGAALWDLDWDRAPEWWQPGPYDHTLHRALGLDCNDDSQTVFPPHGC